MATSIPSDYDTAWKEAIDKPKIYLFVEQWHQNRFPDREEAEYWEKSLKSVLEESDRSGVISTR